MVQLNGKRLYEEKDAINKQWHELMANVNNGILDKERCVYLMDRLNAIDSFLIKQGILKC